MKLLNRLLDLAGAVLQKPEEAVRFADDASPTVTIVPALASLSLAAGYYLVRDYYESIFLFSILFHASVQTAAYVLFASIASALLDARVQLRAGRNVRFEKARRILLHALLPLFFAFPAASIARVTPAPGIVLGIFLLLLHAWVLYSALRALQFLYELSMRDTARELIVSTLITAAFPAVLLILFFVRLAAFL